LQFCDVDLVKRSGVFFVVEGEDVEVVVEAVEHELPIHSHPASRGKRESAQVCDDIRGWLRLRLWLQLRAFAEDVDASLSDSEEVAAVRADVSGFDFHIGSDNGAFLPPPPLPVPVEGYEPIVATSDADGGFV
jgi:hypothetical protein